MKRFHASDRSAASPPPRDGNAGEGRLTLEQRHIVLAVALSAVMLVSMTASFNYVISDMVSDLDATETQTDTLRQAPSIAALLVVFLAGVLGKRLGERRVMMASGVLFAVGSAVMVVAPVMPVATVGQLLASVGKSVLFVVGVALISASIASRDGRASAFGTFSAVQPLAYIVMPVLAGLLLGFTSWRAVAGVWALCGVLATIAVWKWIPHPSPREQTSTGEMLTPALAGLALAAVVQLTNLLPDEGLTRRTWIYIAILIGGVFALVVAMRRLLWCLSWHCLPICGST